MSTNGQNILVVDDDRDTCRNLSDILSDLGFHVDVAHDGPSALELVRENPYDVALLDLKMPGMDGVTLCREIKKLSSGTVAIIVSAYASSATAEEALGAGAWQVLSKPVDFKKLLVMVEEAMGQPLVMIVDDDPDLCSSLGDLLREGGYRCGIAHDEEQAAAQLKDRTYRVALIDLKLPKGDGSSVFRLVRSANPKARTVLITGHRMESEELIEQLLDEGADAVCYKPFDIGRLLATLQQFVAKHGNGNPAAT